MSEQLHAQVSAFVDGELPAYETELLLRRLEQDRELRHAFARYVAIGAAIRREPMGSRENSLVRRVSAVIAQEPRSGESSRRPAVAARRQARRWLRSGAGAAVAATVAGLALLGVQQLQAPGEQAPLVASAPAETATVIGAPESSEPPSYTVPPASAGRRAMPAARLTNYVLAHSEYSSLGRRGVLSGVVAEVPTPTDEVDASATPPAAQP